MSDTISRKKKHPVAMRQRSGARIAAVQLNFQHLFVTADLQSSISDFLMHYASDVADDMQVTEIDNAYFQQLVFGSELHKQFIDDIICSLLGESWKIERLSKADYTILQVAICELKQIPHTPAKVVIKEYSRIADAYNSDVSFVNAVLDKAARLLRTDEMVAS